MLFIFLATEKGGTGGLAYPFFIFKMLIISRAIFFKLRYTDSHFNKRQFSVLGKRNEVMIQKLINLYVLAKELSETSISLNPICSSLFMFKDFTF